MATKEKIKKKAPPAPEAVERPSSAHSQISVKSAEVTNITDNTQKEKFIQDETAHEKEAGGNKSNTTPNPSAKNNEPVKKKKADTDDKKKKKTEDGPEKKKKTEDEKKKKGKKTAVEPSPSAGPTPSQSATYPRDPTGSAVSLRSNASTVKEAWTDNSASGSQADLNPVVTSPSSSVISVREAARENRKYNANMKGPETASQKTEEEEISDHAYIPYKYARNCIAKIMEDMKNMKVTHVRIVSEIQGEYKQIEDETQSQFNTYVFFLRDQYSNKVKTFKQVIDVHRMDLQNKEQYWNEMLQSLAERNNKLLKDKKVLLIQNKVEIERLEREKVEITTELTQKLDTVTASLAVASAAESKASTYEKEVQELKEESEKKNEEIKKLKDRPVSAGDHGDEGEIKQLQMALAIKEEELRVALAGGAVVMATKEEEPKVQSSKPIIAAAVVSTEDKDKMSKERGQITDERDKMMDERREIDDERISFQDDRKKWLDEINRLTIELTAQNKNTAELEVKNDSLKHQLQDMATLQAKYHALESQYEALSVIVKGSDSAKEAAEENISKTKSDKDMMEQEQKNKEEEIKKWEEKFKKKHKRDPTDEDKSDSVKEMYIQKEELGTMVTSLDQKLVTYEKVQKGEVPDPPEVAPVPMVIIEPEVKTVEVTVPDPLILEELQKAQAEIARLRDQISGLQEENTNHANTISQQNEELSNLRDRISQLEAEVAALKAGAATVVTSAVSNEEVEKLTQENRELKKDMKKMLKRMEKQKDTGKTPTGDPDERMQNLEGKVLDLEDKVIDLESDNKGLMDDKNKLAMEKDGLLEQISALTVAASSGTTTATPVMAVAAVAGSKQDQADGCNLPEHADLIIQLEIKSKELIEKDREISEKDRQIEEKDKLIEEKMKEIEKLRGQCKEMRSDMMKMAKSHQKLQTKLKDLDQLEKTKKLLQAMSFYIQEIHREQPPAGEAVKNRLSTVTPGVVAIKTADEKNQKAYDAWAEKFKKKNGKDPGSKDRDAEGEKLFRALEVSKKEHEDIQIKIEALTIMQTGDYKAPIQREKTVIEEETPVKQMEQQMSELDNKLETLEGENDQLKSEKSDMVAKMRELEVQLEEARNKAELQATLATGDMNTEELSNQITSLQKEVSLSEAALRQEKMAHNNTKDELENLRNQMSVVKEEVDNEKSELQTKLANDKKLLDAELKAKDQEISKLTSRNDELEKARLANVPLDTAKEIQNLQAKLALLEKDKNKSGTETTALQGQISELKVKLENANKNLETQRATARETEAKVKNAKTEKDKAVREATSQMEKKEQQRINEDKKRISALERKIKELETVKPVGKGVAVTAVGSDTASQNMKAQVVNLKRENNEANTRIKHLELELKKGGGRPGTAAGGDDKNLQKRHEKILKELEKKLEIEKNKTEKLQESLKGTEEDLKDTKKDRDNKANELRKLEAELGALGVAAKEGVEAASKVKGLEKENKGLNEENKVLTENYNTERVLRKKYYNMVEDMKGKIRVYCRARPLSNTELGRGNRSVLKSQDEYSITVETQRGIKDFQFDQIFMEDSTQEKIFEDTNNLVQSAVDGYNVCIFAYGQTGSGKTFTMIGDKDQKFPGIAPRAFNRIFDLINELKSKSDITVTAYMMELYNDRLIDLFAKPGHSSDDKMDIKVDKKGLVWVKGAVIKEAHNAKELFALFQEGSVNRHTASTKMNDESSRSHLIISLVLETTNKMTGQTAKGKLSLVDLAGSERVGKTGASADQLKEAMSINKSLSALGDVISALSSEQQFIPYRNNKLTMLMQDSLGGNAKTLMFVNISPADYNQDESVISLTYASRVKLITNQASKNSDNKEIARLKSIIAKLKAGEAVDDEDA
ncbi:putative protein tag-278 isoform X1 [Mytilus californianus]|uniref:putative protein tag-278 isoform X1 n=1 Tax=Mytilus californianus TaxID=6549 RepID=UPI0022472809|nr:putative protein tag-278 isoform X1 [Mytilus californianus]XP_052100282.1 putative protein tag-278 isoform X1 [Mytilus californianus]